MGDSSKTSSSKDSKVLITTAAFTALTTIFVSFIGIVPQLRSGDKAEVEKLKRDVEEMKARNSQLESTTPPSGAPISITGSVQSEDAKRPLIGYDIYLLPEGDNQLIAKTDDTGKFTFRAVPRTVYSIIVRDSSNGKSGRALLEDDGEEVQVIGAKVRYRVQR
jgi:hypothetical protein